MLLKYLYIYMCIYVRIIYIFLSFSGDFKHIYKLHILYDNENDKLQTR